jgi:hypothetical protein
MGNPDLEELRKHTPQKGAPPAAQPPSGDDWEAKFDKAAATAKSFIVAVFWIVVAFIVGVFILAMLFADSGGY